MIRQPTFEYTASLAPALGGRGCDRGTAVAAVLIAVSIVDARVFQGRPRQAPHARKRALIYVMESDRVSTLVIMMGRITSTGKPARHGARCGPPIIGCGTRRVNISLRGDLNWFLMASTRRVDTTYGGQ